MKIVLTLCLVCLVLVSPVLAQDPESNNYGLDEVFIGPGGSRDSNSGDFNLNATLGDIGVGESASGYFNLLAGFTTDAEPTLSFAVSAAIIDLGILSTTQTATASANFSVGSYNSKGYVVQTFSLPPTNRSGYSLEALDTPSGSVVGQEQFGMNLVANTSPTTFGANPLQVPDATFSFGEATPNYANPNIFTYGFGDAVARSYDSTGETDYTISYIANIANSTPSGQYGMVHLLVATPTF